MNPMCESLVIFMSPHSLCWTSACSTCDPSAVACDTRRLMFHLSSLAGENWHHFSDSPPSDDTILIVYLRVLSAVLTGDERQCARRMNSHGTTIGHFRSSIVLSCVFNIVSPLFRHRKRGTFGRLWSNDLSARCRLSSTHSLWKACSRNVARITAYCDVLRLPPWHQRGGHNDQINAGQLQMATDVNLHLPRRGQRRWQTNFHNRLPSLIQSVGFIIRWAG